MAFHDPAPALRGITVEIERKPKEDKSGLARQLLDAFKLINDLQLQINELRRRMDAELMCEAPDCGDPGWPKKPRVTQFTGAAEGAMSHVASRGRNLRPPKFRAEETRPTDDDASEWSYTQDQGYRRLDQ